MKYEIRYHEIRSDHVLAVPEYTHKEVVDSTLPKIDKYLRKKGYNRAGARTKKIFDFDFTNNWGAVKVKKYQPPKVKRI